MGTTLTEDIESLRREIQNTKAELMQTAGTLENRVEQYRNWRGVVQREPMRAMGLSILAGFLFALAVPSLGRTARYAASSSGRALGKGLQTAITRAVWTEIRKRYGH